MKIWKRTKEDVVTNHLSLTLPQNTKSLATKEFSDLPQENVPIYSNLEIETSMPTFRSDVGIIEISAFAKMEVAKVIVAPEPSEDCTSHAPYFSTGYASFVTVSKQESLQVFIDTSGLSTENDNTVDIFGTLTISNHDGSQILAANYSVTGASGTMKKLSPDLTVVRKIGKELYVKTGDSVQSKSGGNFNVVLTAQVTWS